jgi:hypothetical protein
VPDVRVANVGDFLSRAWLDPYRASLNHQPQHLHFITFSCYRRLPLLASPRRQERC